MEDRRSDFRKDTTYAAKIIGDKRRPPIDCTVRDLSDNGAKIEVLENAPLPYEFEFEIPDLNLCVRTRVAWTNGRSYGLMFIEAPRMTEVASPSALLTETAPTSETDAKSLVVHMSEAQYERLRRFAFERRVSYQEVIERALRAYLNQQEHSS